jgi:hypothetical protein
MSAVLAALYPNHEMADQVRTRLVKDGFPTDRVDLTSNRELGQVALVPAATTAEKLKQHFHQLFPTPEDADVTDLLCGGVMNGEAVIAVHPRGDIETQRACEILENGGALELRSHDLDQQTLEQAASPADQPVIPHVKKILLGSGQS